MSEVIPLCCCWRWNEGKRWKTRHARGDAYQIEKKRKTESKKAPTKGDFISPSHTIQLSNLRTCWSVTDLPLFGWYLQEWPADVFILLYPGIKCDWAARGAGTTALPVSLFFTLSLSHFVSLMISMQREGGGAVRLPLGPHCIVFCMAMSLCFMMAVHIGSSCVC